MKTDRIVRFILHTLLDDFGSDLGGGGGGGNMNLTILSVFIKLPFL